MRIFHLLKKKLPTSIDRKRRLLKPGHPQLGLRRQCELLGLNRSSVYYQPAPEHKIYPYLLRGVKITRPNQVWSTDITYVPMQRGFMYLVAVIDWYSRYVLSWEISNTLDGDFCLTALNRALEYGTPEIFNTDQGTQFTATMRSPDA